MTDTPIPPLPCTFGDGRVPLAIWHHIRVVEDTGCWHWSGPVSPTGSPIYRRKSVWRQVFDLLCGGKSKDLPRSCPPLCKLQRCVNPDHRVPPAERIPVLTCPTCGAPTYQQFYADPTLAPRPERSPVQHPEMLRAAEEVTRISMAELMEDEFDGPEEDEIPKHPNTIPYGPAEYRLTGRVFKRPKGSPNHLEVQKGDNRRWIRQDKLSPAQESDDMNREDAYMSGSNSAWVFVTREERYGR